MATARCTGWSAAALLNVFGLSSKPCIRPTRLCYLRYQNAVGRAQKAIPRRSLQTAAAYRPHTLEPEAPPPRNTNIPDTSIAGIPFPSDKLLKDVESNTPASPLSRAEDSNISIPEAEAQRSQAVAPSSPETEKKPSGAPRPRRFNFAPKKATINLTQNAVSHLRALLDQPEPKLIRIGTKAKGCSGLAYHLEYVDKPSKLDESVEQDGVKVLIENRALINIIGSEMDWVEDKLSARFVFKNPNISEFNYRHKRLKGLLLTHLKRSNVGAANHSALDDVLAVDLFDPSIHSPTNGCDITFKPTISIESDVISPLM